ncbi:lysosomal-associated transmembrane protein 4A-like [Procambarus clarkii]|uniref:lysosomal-associated transmembrane protein 4A-like n=1 Tax=Procambarus clarkii TaxID=6728 RepID=UPI001E677CE9|nr:uncharacterized protein LOC123766904 [Procambarus clarkii]
MLWEPTGCCCFSRRTGSLILGTLVLIGSLLTIVVFSYGLLTVDTEAAIRKECYKSQEKEDCEKLAGYAVATMVAVHMVVATLNVIFSSMLIHGILKEKPCLMIPHMTMRLLSIIFSIIVSAILIGILIYINEWRAVAVFTIICSLWIFILTYFLLVIRAHYLDMKRSVSDIHQLLVEVSDKNDTPIKAKIFYP